MKLIKFLFVGIFFGIVLTKAEVISWYRIYEMFRFESFHMYGVIGSAVVLGIILTALIKKYQWKAADGSAIDLAPKPRNLRANLLGGILFGLGWAMVGACPGPIYILIGNGFTVMLFVLLSALLGTFTYGLLRNKLPH